MSKTAWVALGVGSSLGLAIGMAISRFTEYRFWPPGDRDWRWWTYVVLGVLTTVSLLSVSYLDWNTYVLPQPETLVVGTVLLVIGITGNIASTFDLGVKETSGMKGELRTDSYYRYTRNPQILFLLVIVVGAVLTANSLAVAAIGVGMGVWFVGMPFAEEPWLYDQYGDDYADYCRDVPRFIGWATIRKLRSDISR